MVYGSWAGRPPLEVHMHRQLRVGMHDSADVGVELPNEQHVVLEGLGGTELVIVLDLREKGKSDMRERRGVIVLEGLGGTELVIVLDLREKGKE